jgi:hypothetical protein
MHIDDQSPTRLYAGGWGADTGGDVCVDLDPPTYTIRTHPRRSEGGCVEAVWAFMVARRGSPGDFGLSMHGALAHHPLATPNAHPSTLHNPRLYACRWAFSLGFRVGGACIVLYT